MQALVLLRKTNKVIPFHNGKPSSIPLGGTQRKPPEMFARPMRSLYPFTLYALSDDTYLTFPIFTHPIHSLVSALGAWKKRSRRRTDGLTDHTAVQEQAGMPRDWGA
jgi:hypothetical protein